MTNTGRSDEPQEGRRRPTGLRGATRYVIGGRWRELATMATTAFLGGIAEALFLVTVTRAAFAITSGSDRVGIVAGWYLSVNSTLLLALCFVTLRIALSSYAVWQSARLASDVVAALRGRLVRAFMRSAWEVQQNQRAGSLQELVLNFTSRAAALMNGTTQGLIAAANLVALLGLAIAVDPIGALVMVLSVGLLGLALRPLRRAVRRRARAASETDIRLASTISEISQVGMELHVFHVQDAAEDRIGAVIDESKRRTRRLQFAQSSATTLYMGLAYLALIAALAVVAASPSATLTTLGAVMLVMLRSLSYGQALQGAYVTVSSSSPAIETIMERLAYLDPGHRRERGTPVGSVGTLVAEHVTFAYAGQPDVLHDVTFKIEPREVVGIVGPSGSGKSTLVRLLLGLLDPQQGRIRADDRDISMFDQAEWSRKVTFVPQAARLIYGTVADNIRFLRDDISDEDVERAGKLAHIHDEIVEFPACYEHHVGEHGGRLSGGQQQRLCIARALVEQPDVLILDEPTSALDVRSEHLIRSTLLGLKDRMSVIVIAHRLSTLHICDRIMVVQGGELKGFDTPATLERTNSFYREALRLSGMR